MEPLLLVSSLQRVSIEVTTSNINKRTLPGTTTVLVPIDALHTIFIAGLLVSTTGPSLQIVVVNMAVDVLPGRIIVVSCWVTCTV